MSDNFFVNDPFAISLNAQIYAETVSTNLANYDYVFDINVGAGGWSTMNTLFNSRYFVQNSGAQNTSGENLVDLGLNANLDSLNALLYGNNAVAISSTMTSVSSNAAYSTLTAGEKLLGLRFLEVVATKVFGHAKARAAIANDTEFYLDRSVAASLINQIASGINNSLVNRKLDIFNVYVTYDRVQLNVNTNNENGEFNADAEANKLFNFDTTSWEFPIYFDSTVANNNGVANLDLLNNGPNVGGNQLLSGSMNVPILLRFHLP
jgi:hypothetical protein